MHQNGAHGGIGKVIGFIILLVITVSSPFGILIAGFIVFTLWSSFKKEAKVKSEEISVAKKYLSENSSRYFSEKNKMQAYDEACRKWNEKQAEIHRKEEEAKRVQVSFWENLNGTAFEKEIVKIFQRCGYSVMHTGQSGDQGIDLILNNKIIVQCKNHGNPIGRPVCQQLYGELQHNKG